MAKGVTNAELLQRVAQSHAAAGEVLVGLTHGTPPPPAADLYAVLTRLRNATRAAHCAAQELKSRVKAQLQGVTEKHR